MSCFCRVRFIFLKALPKGSPCRLRSTRLMIFSPFGVIVRWILRRSWGSFLRSMHPCFSRKSIEGSMEGALNVIRCARLFKVVPSVGRERRTPNCRGVTPIFSLRNQRSVLAWASLAVRNNKPWIGLRGVFFIPIDISILMIRNLTN